MRIRFLPCLILALGAGLTACTPAAPRAASVPPATDNYRTIAAQPLRDTDAAKRHNQTGLDHLENNRLQEAEAAFRQALQEDVDFGPAHNNLGKVLFLQKDWYAAAWEFEYARKLMPRMPEPMNNLGLVYEQAGELDRAIEVYQQAVGLDAENLQLRGNLARALVRRGERTPELKSHLELIIAKDTRPEWVVWARQQLAQQK